MNTTQIYLLAFKVITIIRVYLLLLVLENVQQNFRGRFFEVLKTNASQLHHTATATKPTSAVLCQSCFNEIRLISLLMFEWAIVQRLLA